MFLKYVPFVTNIQISDKQISYYSLFNKIEVLLKQSKLYTVGMENVKHFLQLAFSRKKNDINKWMEISLVLKAAPLFKNQKQLSKLGFKDLQLSGVWFAERH